MKTVGGYFMYTHFSIVWETIEPQQRLAEEGRKIVKQCGNLPLAIKTIAASLANTTDLRKWEFKRRQLEGVVTPIGDPDPVMEILKLSYDSLPAHLKPCFEYLSFFPEDEKIYAEYLIILWIAEGIVPAREEQWDMVMDWLDQFAQLCVLQVCENNYGNKFYKMHDLLPDLAIHILKEKKCVFSVDEVSTHTSGATGWCRILLARKCLHENAISKSRPVYLRTLTVSELEDYKHSGRLVYHYERTARSGFELHKDLYIACICWKHDSSEGFEFKGYRHRGGTGVCETSEKSLVSCFP